VGTITWKLPKNTVRRSQVKPSMPSRWCGSSCSRKKITLPSTERLVKVIAVAFVFKVPDPAGKGRHIGLCVLELIQDDGGNQYPRSAGWCFVSAHLKVQHGFLACRNRN